VLYLIVFVGGGLGAAVRHAVNLGAARLVGTSFPYGTMAINVTGSLAMGVLAGYLAFRTTAPISQHWRLFLTTGFLGGYTTFSAFSLEAALLIERGQHVAAGVYALGSVILGIVALFVGIGAGRALL
jgi:CrcB protein